MCKEFGVSTVVYNPLAGGMLTGKQKRDAPLKGTRFDGNQMYLSRYWHAEDFDAVGELLEIAKKAGPLAGEPGAQLAATPYACRLRDSGRIEAGAAGRESESNGGWSAQRRYCLGVRPGVGKDPRRRAPI